MTTFVYQLESRNRQRQKADEGRRLADLLRSQILDGAHRAGQALPSEAELRAAHRAGRNVVRAALDLLRSDAYVSRRPGQGTLVQSERVTHTLGDLGGISKAYVGGGRRVITQFRSVNEVVATQLIADRLLVDEGERCLVVEYETMVDHRPYSIATSYLRSDLAGTRFLGDLAGDWFGDWFDVLRELGFDLGSLELRVEAAAADRESAAALDLPTGAPIMRFERLLHDAAGQPIDFGYSRCRSDRVLLSVQVG